MCIESHRLKVMVYRRNMKGAVVMSNNLARSHLTRCWRRPARAAAASCGPGSGACR